MSGEQSFDYVIVGAGSAGCVLAHRLSEDEGARVLVLEAGARNWKPEIHVPAASSRLHRSSVDWGFETEPQEHGDGRRVYVPRGKTLGGCSSTNTMIYIRGQPPDYDGWAAAGCPGWSWDELRPYFLRSEDFDGPAGPHHATGGLLRVERSNVRYDNPLWHAFVRAGESLGYRANDDFNGTEQEGFGLFHVTTRDGRRCSTARAFLRPAMRRPNLELRTGARTLRVLLEGGRASGVEYLRRGRTHRVRAEREVLLCAGALQSPQLLMLSGIGPPDHLRERGIDVRHALAGVGENLQDHPILTPAFGCSEPITINTQGTRAGTVLRWLVRRDGMLSAVLPAAGAFVRVMPDAERPDVELHFVHGWSEDLHDYDRLPRTDGFVVAPVLLRPQARGTVRLRSDSPLDAPCVDPALLGHAHDRATMLAAFRFVTQLIEDPAFEGLRDGWRVPPSPPRTDDEIMAFVRQNVGTTYHPVGTCRMGSDDDAVLDPQLRVRGVEGLRVVDASVMPTVPSGNTNAPVIAIAERAAEFIGGRSPS